MPVILAMDFRSPPPFGPARDAALAPLAESIARDTPGLLWKIWTEDEANGEAGGIYLFVDRASADAYLHMHRARLLGFGIAHVNAKLFDVNTTLSAIDRAPLGA